MKTLSLYAAIVGVGIVIGLLLRSSPAPETVTAAPLTDTAVSAVPASNTADITPANVPADINARLNMLNQQLKQVQETLRQESAARHALEQRVAQLKDHIALPASAKASAPETESRRDRELHTRPITSTSQQPEQWFNAQALIDVGVDESEANHIRQVYEDVEMQKLYLRDQAIREGWIGDERYQKERASLDAKQDSLRDELGDKAYDAYLYASGRPNRVIIVSALDNSPASKAGIKSGDTVLRYDNKRIYNWNDLRTATTQGEPDAVVNVDIIRDGNPMTVYVPRGPLGVQLDNQSVAP